MIFHRLLTTCLGIGYIRKGGGTVASVFCCLIWYFTKACGNNYIAQVLIVCLLVAAGVWSAGKMEPAWGKDSYRIVIDEVAGMGFTLMLVPFAWQYILTGLFLFRFFDIAKPLYIRRTEAWKGGWGVMMDDVAAGLYSNILLHLIMLAKLW